MKSKGLPGKENSTINYRARRTLRRVFVYAIFVIVFAVIVYPLVWMFYTSFKLQWEIFANPFALPHSLNPVNYIQAWNTGNFKQYFLNSLIVTIPSVFLVLVLSSLAGYGFARFHFRGDSALFLFFLAGIMVPPQAIIIPAFIVISHLKLIDNFASLIVTYLSWCSVGIFILRTFFRTLPAEIEDAARIDGCSSFKIFWRIALPLAQPALATVAIFYFVWIWNDFLYPLLYLQKTEMDTIPLGLMQFKGQYTVNWGPQAAALSIATFVPLIFYMVFQDRFVRGLTAGALKG